MTAQLSLFCGHRYGRRVCIVEAGHFGCHFDGAWNWTVEVRLAPLRRGAK